MRWTALALALAWTALHATPCRGQSAQGASGAPSDDALAAARQLFTEAVGDQDAKRYDTALDKFRRVAAVKETANVRYRIASCLDALGRRAEALASYAAAARLGAQDPFMSDAVQASRARAAELDASVARLSVVVPADAPAGTEVRVDEGAVELGALGAPVPLDPGHHTLRATAPGRVPFETAVTLSAGGRVSIAVTLPLAAPSPASASPSPGPGGTRATPTAAWVAVGVGGALAVGSVVALVLRQSNMATLNRDCTANGSGALACPSSTADEVNGAHDAAKIEGPLGIGLGAGAVVALGIGAWLFASAPSSGSSAIAVMPAWSSEGGGILVRGAL
jgi:hypothetical protein